ncbi:hypothetical protein FHG87_004489 [Trinorchestia longiramus]|nr:hypothetical protein FHG87_004489 [Trinorchestia longiramus]
MLFSVCSINSSSSSTNSSSSSSSTNSSSSSTNSSSSSTNSSSSSTNSSSSSTNSSSSSTNSSSSTIISNTNNTNTRIRVAPASSSTHPHPQTHTSTPFPPTHVLYIHTPTNAQLNVNAISPANFLRNVRCVAVPFHDLSMTFPFPTHNLRFFLPSASLFSLLTLHCWSGCGVLH